MLGEDYHLYVFGTIVFSVVAIAQLLDNRACPRRHLAFLTAAIVIGPLLALAGDLILQNSGVPEGTWELAGRFAGAVGAAIAGVVLGGAGALLAPGRRLIGHSIGVAIAGALIAVGGQSEGDGIATVGITTCGIGLIFAITELRRSTRLTQ